MAGIPDLRSGTVSKPLSCFTGSCGRHVLDVLPTLPAYHKDVEKIDQLHRNLSSCIGKTILISGQCL